MTTICSPVNGLGMCQKELWILLRSSRGGSGYTLIYAAELVSLLSWFYDYIEGLHIFFEQLAVPVI